MLYSSTHFSSSFSGICMILTVCLLFTPTYCNPVPLLRDLCSSALILSLAQCVTVASGCSSKCPQLQFRQSKLSIFQCFDGSPGSGHLSAPLSLHLQPAVGGMTHAKTLSLVLAFSVPLKKRKSYLHRLLPLAFKGFSILYSNANRGFVWRIFQQQYHTTITFRLINHVALFIMGHRVHSLSHELVLHNRSLFITYNFFVFHIINVIRLVILA